MRPRPPGRLGRMKAAKNSEAAEVIGASSLQPIELKSGV